MEESSAWAREEAGVPVWLQFEDLAAHASVRYEAAVPNPNPNPHPNPNPNPNPKPDLASPGRGPR